MIVVDSSALLAVLLKESDGHTFQQALSRGEPWAISAVNAHETATVLRLRHGRPAVEWLWEYLRIARIDIVPFDEEQVRAAAIALDRYGTGIDPRARLNLADCAAYALAKTRRAPILFKGGDFRHTDLQSYL